MQTICLYNKEHNYQRMRVLDMRKNRFVSLLGALVIGSSAWAESLSLQQAVDESLQSSPKIQKVKSAVNESKWKTREAYSGFLPSLNASVTYLTDKKYLLTDVTLGGNPTTIPSIVPTSIGTLSAQWSIFDGFASTNRLQSASSVEDAAQADFDWALFQHKREIALLYYKVLAAQQLKQVAEQNVIALEEIVKNVQIQRRVGVTTNFDVLRSEVQLSESRSEVLNATDNLEIAKSRLAEALGRNTDDVEVQGVLPVLKADLIAGLQKESAGDRRDLVALKLKTQAVEYSEKSAEKYWVPKVALIGQYNYYNNRNNRFDDWDRYRDSYSVGVTVSWNLFDGMSSISKSKQSVEQKVQAQQTLQQALLKAGRDFDMWKRKYSYNCQVYASKINDIAKAEESSRLAHEGQKVGARTGTEVLIAEAELYRSKAQAVYSQIGAIEALFNLEMASGKEIFKF